MDIAASLAALTSALQITKELRQIDQDIDKAEMKGRLAEVVGKLADVKLALIDAQEDLRSKDAEITRLREAFQFRGTLTEVRGFKLETFEDGGPRGEPFCPRCEQNVGRFYRLNFKVGGDYACPECKSSYSRVPAHVWER